jgi:N-acetylglutamate synthase-like GNAT family acetyltransferase
MPPHNDRHRSLAAATAGPIAAELRADGPTPSDSPFHIRRARASDRPALIDMLSRCTRQTRLRRFHGNPRAFPEPYLTEALAETAEHFALVAEISGAVAALASCRAVAEDIADLAVLVEDAHQRQGIGSCLLRMLVDHADRSGLRTLTATVLADQEWILRVLRSYGACRAPVSFGMLEVTLRRPGRLTTGPAGAAGIPGGTKRANPAAPQANTRITCPGFPPAKERP